MKLICTILVVFGTLFDSLTLERSPNRRRLIPIKAVRTSDSDSAVETTALSACNSIGCLNSEQCQQSNCCKNGCRDGFSGENCDSCLPGYYRYESSTHSVMLCEQCRKHCATCTLYRCTRCEDGYYGYMCHHECSSGCLGNKCDKDSGECSLGCKANYHGSHCRPCGNCLNIQCNQNGTCTQGCKDSFYGKTCKPCSIGCTHGTCNQEDGTCSCKSGYTGIKCESCLTGWFISDDGRCSECPNSCISCTAEYSCSSCKTGFHGYFCYRNCPKGCLNNECDKDSGKCNGGCKDAFFGNRCDMVCNTNCLNISNASRCYQNNGSCIAGYKEGFCEHHYGVDGNESSTSKTNGHHKTATTTIVISLVVLVFVITATIVASYAVVRRRLKTIENEHGAKKSPKEVGQKPNDSTSHEGRDTTDNVYEDITEGERIYSNSYQCLAMDIPVTNRTARQIDNTTYINLKAM